MRALASSIGVDHTHHHQSYVLISPSMCILYARNCIAPIYRNVRARMRNLCMVCIGCILFDQDYYDIYGRASYYSDYPGLVCHYSYSFHSPAYSVIYLKCIFHDPVITFCTYIVHFRATHLMISTNKAFHFYYHIILSLMYPWHLHLSA